jgi:hypothetical protein
MSSNIEYLDEIAKESWGGNYERTGALSAGELLYVALAAGRMRELAPGESIAYAVDRVGPAWMAHMLRVWGCATQPNIDTLAVNSYLRPRGTIKELLASTDDSQPISVDARKWLNADAVGR